MRHQQSCLLSTLLLVLIAALLAISLPTGLVDRVYADGPPYHPDEVVVKLDTNSGKSINDINAKYGTTTIKSVTYDNDTYLLQLPPGADAQLVASQLGTDATLDFAEPNYTSHVPESAGRGIGGFGGFDPAPFSSQYAVDLLGLAEAHAISTGREMLIAVIDTGVQLNHAMLKDSLTLGYDFVASDPLPDDEANGLDDDGDGLMDEAAGHGTHVAGIIHLVAPDALIMPLRVLDSDGNGDVCNVAEAIDYAVAHGADVINLSLGTSAQSDLLKDVIRNATLQGAVVIAATGNLHTDVVQYPAATPCALSVTSVGPTAILSDFANYGGWVDFAAPGEAIYSTLPTDGYGTWSGTSMAAPFVAGQAALILSRAPWMNARRVAALIGSTAKPLDALNPIYAGRLGLGQVNVGASLAALTSDDDLPSPRRSLISSSCVTYDD